MSSLSLSGWSSEGACQKVRSSCEAWMQESQHKKLVSINTPALHTLAQEIIATASPTAIEWDEENWHYMPSTEFPKEIASERLALYILALDAINFCFWPSHNEKNNENEPNFEYEHLAIALARMAKSDEEYQHSHPSTLSPHYIFAPSRLASMSETEMASLFEEQLATIAKPKKITSLDNISTRIRLWNEIGKVLLEQWNGSILEFLQIEKNQNCHCALSAPQLVDRIVQNFPGFRDCYPWRQKEGDDPLCSHLYLYKRAQICVGDWNASLKLNLSDLDQVTTFADYRVPQLLRNSGVLEYSAKLGESIDNGLEIVAGSMEEKTIRAATVVAVERLVQELQDLTQKKPTTEGTPVFTAIAVDWHLWQVGEKMQNEGLLKPHHRTRTTFY